MANVHDAMWRIFDYAISYLDIVPDTAASNEDVETIAKLLNAYDELEPDWSNAPEWAQWYAIDASSYVNGNSPACFYADEPQLNGCEWYSKTGYHIEADDVKLPLGIDWRLCKWQRPETTR